MTASIGVFIAMILTTNQNPGPENWGCGAQSLYQLFKCVAINISPEQILPLLPPANPQGHSLGDLQRVAKQLGLTLEALDYPIKSFRVESPIIMFFRIGSEGHFVVVRPVGHTGKLVQVLDGDRSPTVINCDDLTRLSSWTGLALVPQSNNISFWGLAAGGSIAICLGAFLQFVHFRLRSNPSRSTT
ncbi:cysteine peptidase family C39 domain-containing protein [Paludisphaera rhizosphaerae]|uniref:cysteine peptidase family C39 domain-containing protein n=1 Tax=Paludisphaera rhizosphaerae TaxID=2711216 RepID=UPI0013EA630D|nr:cysteine peptidase family C39 domain-containing protein [Paludisphaera rhizosphaerae]